MEKIRYKDLEIIGEIDNNDKTKIFLTSENSILKIFDLEFIINLLDNNYDIEDKVLNASKLIRTPEIILPNRAVYKNGNFIGYTMPYFEGISIYEFADYNRNVFSINNFNNFFLILEDTIKKSDNIVFPDLLSDGNIMVNMNEIALVDFDGLQISNYSSPVISSSLGNRSIYENTKYMKNNLFTKELDIKSLIYLYFDINFDCDLWNIDIGLSYDECKKELERIFKYHGIDNNELFNKVLTLYDNNKSNIYLENTIDFISNNYEIDYELYNYNNVKKLVRK